MTYRDIKDLLTSERFNVSNLGLDRIKIALELLDNPQDKLKIVHVVGTNGKGSTSSLLCQMLNKSGIKTGLFSSPYISEPTEYMSINGKEITKSEFVILAERVLELLNSNEITLTHFEFVTVMAILYFTLSNCQIAVLEAGMGGETDATNISNNAILTVLTSMSIDHTSFLGDTLEDIVNIKCGIAHTFEPLLSQDVILENLKKDYLLKHKSSDGIDDILNEEFSKKTELIRKACASKGIELCEWGEGEAPRFEYSLKEQGLMLTYGDIWNMFLNSHAVYQVKNALTAIEAYIFIMAVYFDNQLYSEAAIRNACAEFSLKSRYETIMDKPRIIVDGGHNPDCVKNTINALKVQYPNRKFRFVTAVMADKDYKTMYEMLAPYADEFICVDNSYKRALKTDELADYIDTLNINTKRCYTTLLAAAYIKASVKEDDMFVFIGTLYLSDQFKLDIKKLYAEDFSDALYAKYIDRLTSTNFFSKNASFDDMNKIFERLNHPEDSLKVIHVAGTNGKGSVCSMVDSILRTAGYDVGLFTSPYIHNFSERIRFNNKEIGKDYLIAIAELIFGLEEELGTKLNQFALVTLIAIVYYKHVKADYVVLETGLGGTYDPTNIIKKPLCSVITNIGLDHTKVLGDTIEKIAEAKAGIIKKKVPVIVYPSDTDALKVIKSKAKEIGAPCLVISDDMVGITNNLNDTEFVYKDKNYKIPLLGFYQAFNAILAIEACNVVLGAKTRSSKLSEEQKAKIIKYIDKCIVKGLRECAWEGRLEKLSDSPLVFVDGGHNPQCIDYITDYFNNAYPYHEKIYISGFLKDKDYKYMIKTLASSSSALYLVKVNNPRSLSYEELSSEVSELEIPAHAFESIEAAYKKAKVEIQKYEENGMKSLICFVGSLYQLNDVYKAVKGSDKE